MTIVKIPRQGPAYAGGVSVRNWLVLPVGESAKPLMLWLLVTRFKSGAPPWTPLALDPPPSALCVMVTLAPVSLRSLSGRSKVGKRWREADSGVSITLEADGWWDEGKPTLSVPDDEETSAGWDMHEPPAGDARSRKLFATATSLSLAECAAGCTPESPM